MERPEERRFVWIICLVLAVVTFVVYLPITHHDFVFFDDATYVFGNPYIVRGITPTDLVWAFTTGHGSNWHPLTWISHMLDAQIYGIKHPGGHHLTSLLFHVANTVLLFVALRRMSGALWRSALVAALFAWHPMHVESVAWVSERKDMLSTFFWVLTMLAYTRYAREPAGPARKRHYIWTIVFFALGLMSKPMVVTLPFTLLLLDYWPLKRWRGTPDTGENPPVAKLSWPQLAAEKIPLFAMSAVSSVATFFVQKFGGAVMHIDTMPSSVRVANSMMAYAGYLRRLVWPSGLSIFYPLRPIYLNNPRVIAAAVLLVALSGLALWLARRRPYVLFGWLWFLGTLVPVIGLVQVGAQSMADRYSYMSFVGLFIIFAWGMADLVGHGRLNRFWPAWVIITPLLIGCLAVTRKQITYWQDTETLFRRNLAVVEDNSTAHVSLGVNADDVGRPEEAETELLAALKIQPHSPNVLNALGLHYAKHDQVTNAMNCYYLAIQNDSTFSDAHYNLADLLASQERYPEAEAQYREALRSKPDSPDAHNNLGAVLLHEGRLPEAMTQFKEALRLLPDYPEAQDQMGGVLLKMGHPELAQLHYEEAVRIKPEFAHAQLKLGLVLAEQSYLEEAIPHFQTAIKLEPTNADAYFNLAAAYAALNRFQDAAQTFGEVLQRQPEDVEARVRMAGALQSAGKTEAAVDNYRAALRLRMDQPEALRGLAWILATTAKPELRNGAEAVRLAEHANELTGRKDPLMLSALDAAYAETGRFDEAIKTAEQAQQFAAAQNRKDLADKAVHRLELYRAGKAFHE